MNWIQNDNQNIGVDHPKAWQSLLPLHCSTFYSITLRSFDAFFYLMIVSDYMWKHLLFWFLHLCFFVEILYRRCVLAPLPYNNENTDSRSTSIAQIYLDFFEVW